MDRGDRSGPSGAPVAGADEKLFKSARNRARLGYIRDVPIKSQAQRRKFAELLVEGKITPEVFERWNREAGSKELPEHVKPKAGARSRSRTKAATKRSARAPGKKRTAR